MHIEEIRKIVENGGCFVKDIKSKKIKILKSKKYNYIFDKHTGYFARWGETEKDDPPFSPFGPEILDLEISVNGCPNNCSFCYKGNTNDEPINMSLESHNKIIDKISEGNVLTQVAYGITGVQTNPDFIEMMKYCRNEKGIIPNFTLTGIDLTDKIAKEISQVAGALAVSAYESDKNVCYDTVKKFTDLGMEQVNIHLMVSKETLPFVTEVLHDRKFDDRLAKMNAIVFLGMKPKGRAKEKFHPIDFQDFDLIVKTCQNLEIPYGFDSCSAPKFEQSVRMMDIDEEEKQNLIRCSESCESGLFSSYINVHGEFFPCSFTEGERGWEEGISVVDCDNFLKDVWYHERTIKWRNDLINTAKDGCRLCPTFPCINP